MRRQLITGLRMTIALTVLLGLAYPLAMTGIAQALMKNKANGSFVKKNGTIVGSSLIGQQFVLKNGDPDPRYFQPRPSSGGYDSMASGGSNFGPVNANLIGNVPGAATGDDGKPIKSNPYATPADPYCVPVQSTDKDGNDLTDKSGNAIYDKNTDGTYVCDSNTVPERVLAYRQMNGLGTTVRVPVDAVTASGSGLDPDISIANARLQVPRVAQERGVSEAKVLALVSAHTDNRSLGFLGEKAVNVLELNIALDKLPGRTG